MRKPGRFLIVKAEELRERMRDVQMSGGLFSNIWNL